MDLRPHDRAVSGILNEEFNGAEQVHTVRNYSLRYMHGMQEARPACPVLHDCTRLCIV